MGISWNLIGLTVMYVMYCWNCNHLMAVAIDVLDESESDDINESFEQPQIWSSLLEELTIKWVHFSPIKFNAM